jgi:hypothetical protein
MVGKGAGEFGVGVRMGEPGIRVGGGVNSGDRDTPCSWLSNWDETGGIVEMGVGFLMDVVWQAIMRRMAVMNASHQCLSRLIFFTEESITYTSGGKRRPPRICR